MRSAISSIAIAAAALLPTAFAHYNFEALIVNGNITDPYEYVRQTNNSNSPIEDVTSQNMVCNSGGLSMIDETFPKSLFLIHWLTGDLCDRRRHNG